MFSHIRHIIGDHPSQTSERHLVDMPRQNPVEHTFGKDAHPEIVFPFFDGKPTARPCEDTTEKPDKHQLFIMA